MSVVEQSEALQTRDVIVVGARPSGLAAARDIVRQGVDVLVLEARDRVGGRTLSRRLDNAVTIDLGGRWLTPAQRRVQALAREQGLGIFRTLEDSKHTQFVDGRIQFPTGRKVDDSDEVHDDHRGSIGALDSLAAASDQEAPWTHRDDAALDMMTFAQWIDQSIWEDL